MKVFLLITLCLVVASVSGFLPPQQGKDDDVITVPFVNQSLWVTMRDGVRLWTVIYTPAGGGIHGAILQRTPYTTSSTGSLANEWLPLGFAVVNQDQRGSGRSRGDTFKYWRYDGYDGKDTMEWIVAQPWSNGNVFTVGDSANGNAVLAGLYDSPTHLRAIAPVVATGHGHATTYQGGAFRQALIRNWLTGLGFVFTLQEVRENEANGEWWDTVVLPGKEDLCNVPGVFSAGWFDIFSNENIDTFHGCQYISSSPNARGQHKLVVDPSGHCRQGDYPWPNNKIPLAGDLTKALFLAENGDEVPAELIERIKDAKEITFYVMGPEDGVVGNYWTTMSHWPVPTASNFYLHADGTLQTTPPTALNASATYQYDPEDPVETIGGPELFLPCGPRDQRPVESRADVLVFTLAPFKEHVAVVGNLTATLYVESDVLDTDFTVKITDVYPDGRSMLLTDGVVRMKWRDSDSVPTHMQQGVIYEIEVNLWKTAHIFNSGHSLRVAVSSSNHPRFERNPNNGLPISENGDFFVATNTVYFDLSRPSRVTLPVVDLSAIPENYFP